VPEKLLIKERVHSATGVRAVPARWSELDDAEQTIIIAVDSVGSAGNYFGTIKICW
jgi:hypothetical protein